jgi:hypothetical protein
MDKIDRYNAEVERYNAQIDKENSHEWVLIHKGENERTEKMTYAHGELIRTYFSDSSGDVYACSMVFIPFR